MNSENAPRVIIVDDVPKNIQLIGTILRSEGYVISAATSGAEALEAIKINPPDLVLMDIMMPDMDGFETCQKLKSDAESEKIPIIFLSALQEDADKVKAFDCGGVDYVTKPIQPGELIARVKTHLLISQLQNKLERTNSELRESLEELELAKDHLVRTERMAALGNMVSGIAHEVNTPVGIGITETSFLNQRSLEIIQELEEDRLTKSSLEKFLTIASETSESTLNNLRRAANLIMAFKQVSVDQSMETKRVFFVKEYIDEILFSLSGRFKKLQPSITVVCPEELKIDSYPGIISQAITQFIENSLIHGVVNGKTIQIQLELALKDQTFYLFYKDNGGGMDDVVVK